MPRKVESYLSILSVRLVLLITIVIPNAVTANALVTNPTPKLSLTLAVPQEQHLSLNTFTDIVRAAFSLENIAINIVSVPGNRASHEASAGKIDGELARTEFLTRQYKELVPIKVSLRTTDYWVYVHAKNNCPESIEELLRMRSVSLLGAAIYTEIDSLTLGSKHTVSSPDAVLRVLQAKRADYIVAPELALKTYSNGQGYTFKQCFQKPFISTRIYTFLNKRHEHLVPALEQAYRKVLDKTNN